MRLSPTPLLLAALLGLSQCKKSDPDPASQLPPASHTGANTAGFLLNGQAWLPWGKDNFVVDYDPTLGGTGVLNVSLSRPETTSQRHELVTIHLNPFNKAGTYELKSSPTNGISFIRPQQFSICSIILSTDTDTYCQGSITITHLDAQTGIVSGTFELTLYKLGCDTIKITQGRFDKKL
jgi:hypothetical protein